MAFAFRIDRGSGIASYLQIVQQVQQAVRLGMLKPGDRLPTAREVVEATALNPNTVLKAYHELEHQGLAETRRRHGTFIVGTLGTVPADSPWRAELADMASRVRAAGIERDALAALFAAVLEDVYSAKDPDAAHPQQQ